MKKLIFFTFSIILIATLVVFSVAKVSAYNSNKVEKSTNNYFSSPAASENYLKFGKINNSQSVSSTAKTILGSTGGDPINVAQRSSGCSMGCSSGCSVGCSSGCSSGCRD